MIFSLPDVCESIWSVVRGFIAQFQAGENSRFTKQGVGQKSSPRVRVEIRAKSGCSLTTRGVRHREGIWRGRGTLRNLSANTVASSEDKPVGEVLPLDITLEIDRTSL